MAVVKALLQNERLRVGGSLNFDFRNTFAKSSMRSLGRDLCGALRELWRDPLAKLCAEPLAELRIEPLAELRTEPLTWF